MKWPFVSREKYDLLCEIIRIYQSIMQGSQTYTNKLREENARLQKELNACWKYINADTQLKRKKEEAKKPREKNGRFARKC